MYPWGDTRRGNRKEAVSKLPSPKGYVQGLGGSGGSSREDSTRPHPLVVAPFPPEILPLIYFLPQGSWREAQSDPPPTASNTHPV